MDKMRYNKWRFSQELALKLWYPDIKRIMLFTNKKHRAVYMKALRLRLTGTHKKRIFTGYKKTPTNADVIGKPQRLMPYCDLLS